MARKTGQIIRRADRKCGWSASTSAAIWKFDRSLAQNRNARAPSLIRLIRSLGRFQCLENRGH
jgi:hypothetical protein